VRKNVCHIKHGPVPYITEMGLVLFSSRILFSPYNTYFLSNIMIMKMMMIIIIIVCMSH
jgi:hypothetical protein